MRLFEVNKNENAVYFMMAYSNPPTYGYKMALDKLKQISSDSDHVVFISSFQDDFLNPLSHDSALRYNMNMFPDVRFYKKADIQNSLEALEYLSKKYNIVYMVTEDDNVRKFDRYHHYAEDWGVFDFDIVGLGDSEYSIPEEKKNRTARKAVVDNKYELFKKAIPSDNETLISKMYLELRKIMLGAEEKPDPGDEEVDEKSKEKEKEVKEYVESIIQFIADKNLNFSILHEYCNKDDVGNTLLKLGHVDEKLDRIRIVMSEKFKNFSVGKDRHGHIIIFVNTTRRDLDKTLEMNRSHLKEALSKALMIIETTTAANFASVSMPLGKEPVRRSMVRNYDFVHAIKRDDNEYNKLQKSMKMHIDKYGYIDNEAIKMIRSILDKGKK